MDEVELKLEISALRLVFLNDRYYTASSHEQAAALGSLMNLGLRDHRRLLRLEILKEITGLPQLGSSLQLTAHTVSTLIAYLKRHDDWRLNENAIEFLQALEARCMERLPARKEGRRRSLEAGVDEDTQSSLEVFDDSQTERQQRYDRCRSQPAEERADAGQGIVYPARVAAILSHLWANGALSGYARGDFDAW